MQGNFIKLQFSKRTKTIFTFLKDIAECFWCFASSSTFHFTNQSIQFDDEKGACLLCSVETLSNMFSTRTFQQLAVLGALAKMALGITTVSIGIKGLMLSVTYLYFYSECRGERHNQARARPCSCIRQLYRKIVILCFHKYTISINDQKWTTINIKNTILTTMEPML
jgi:hypothetical protein